MVRSVSPANAPRHVNPIPAAAVHRGIVTSSAITGRDPATGSYPTDKAEQIELAFRHFETIAKEAGASLQDVVKVDLYMASKEDRALVNPHWLRLYPDAAARPSRHAHTAELEAGCYLHIVFMAIVDED